MTPRECADRLCTLTTGLERLRDTLAVGSWRRAHLSRVLADLDRLIDAGSEDALLAPLPPDAEDHDAA